MGLVDRFMRLLPGAGGEARADKVNPVHPGDPGVAAIWGVNLSSAGGAVTVDTAMQVPAFAACSRLLCDTIATVPLDFFKRVNDDTRERDKGNARAQVMQWPNEWQSGPDFRRFLAQSTMLHGNGYARLRFANNGAPIGATPLDAGRTMPFRDSQRRVWYRHWPDSGGVENYASGEILHVRGPWLEGDGLVAASPVIKFRDQIGLALAQCEYLAKYFSNSAMPKGGIEVPSTLGDKAAEALITGFERRHKGLENAHRIAVFDGGMKWKELGLDNVKGQVVENYGRTVTTIASIFGIPPHMIGEVSQSTSWGTGIEQQAIGFITFVARPWFVGFEQAYNRALLTVETRDKFYFEHNADGLLRGDLKSRMDAFALAIQWGLMTPNEVRRLMNLAPLEGGDERLQPLNMAPASLVKQVLTGQPDKAKRALNYLNALARGQIVEVTDVTEVENVH